MRYVTLSEQDEIHLRHIHANSTSSRARNRAQAILWSHQGYSRPQLAKLFNVRKDTISDWFNLFEADRRSLLLDQAGRGRKPKLNEQQQSQLRKHVEKTAPRSLKKN